jgi:hypothetical protein
MAHMNHLHRSSEPKSTGPHLPSPGRAAVRRMILTAFACATLSVMLLCLTGVLHAQNLTPAERAEIEKFAEDTALRQECLDKLQQKLVDCLRHRSETGDDCTGRNGEYDGSVKCPPQ